MAKKENGRELLRQDNESLRKQFVDCRKLLEEERKKNEVLTANKDGAISLLDESIKTSTALADKVIRYEKALTKISTRKMSTYLTTSHMNRDFIKTATDALDNTQN